MAVCGLQGYRIYRFGDLFYLEYILNFLPDAFFVIFSLSIDFPLVNDGGKHKERKRARVKRESERSFDRMS